jgi:predicted N-acetyltransferase YhbS
LSGSPPKAGRKLPRHPVPVVLLARRAVDVSAQGHRLGELLPAALQRSLELSAGLGVHAVEMDGLNDTAAAFYRSDGFVPLLDDPLHLDWPTTTVAQVLASIRCLIRSKCTLPDASQRFPR